MASLGVLRAKPLIVNALNDKLKYAALYRTNYDVVVGQNINFLTTTGKSDDSPYSVKLNYQTGGDKYEVINDFSHIEWDGDIGLVTGINSIMNFFIKDRNNVDKIVISNSHASGVVHALIKIPTIYPKDESFFINKLEITIE